MKILFRWHSNVNSFYIYEKLRPKFDFIFGFFEKCYNYKSRTYRLSHKWAHKINYFVYEILTRILSDEERSKYHWIHNIGRTEKQWRKWYFSKREIEWRRKYGYK